MLIRKLFTKSEKYMLARACEERVYQIEGISVMDRWVDRDDAHSDISDYHNMIKIFSQKGIYTI